MLPGGHRSVLRRRAWLLAAVLFAAGLPACTGEHGAAATSSSLAPVTIPDLSRLDPAVQSQIAVRHQALLAAKERGAAPAELGRSYGELGMLLQAAELYDAAEPALLNAQQLLPGEVRWPYYLAHLHQRRGEAAKAEAEFVRTLSLSPDDVPAHIWLGRLYLDEGRTDDASRMFTRAVALAPQAVAALAGLGRVELARRNFGGAAARFERALQIDPAAASLHAPLAAAYRGLNDTAKAEAHQQQWVDGDLLVADPLQQELEMLLETPLSNELRGVRALDRRDWRSASEYFRRGLALAHENTLLRRSLQHKLGTALHLAGDADAAERQFRQVVAAAPPAGVDEATAKAHYSLGVILMSRRRTDDAIAHFDQAVRYQPTYVEARLALAEVLRRNGRIAESIPHYDRALAQSAGDAPARLGRAMALIRLGREREARTALEEAVAVHPDRPEFVHVLARLLAVARDGRVRDGAAAMRLVERLMTGIRTTELGETMAMALAEVGEYDRAASVQQGVLSAVRRGGEEAAIRRVEQNLRRYESGLPCRTFWEETEPS